MIEDPDLPEEFFDISPKPQSIKEKTHQRTSSIKDPPKRKERQVNHSEGGWECLAAALSSWLPMVTFRTGLYKKDSND